MNLRKGKTGLIIEAHPAINIFVIGYFEVVAFPGHNGGLFQESTPANPLGTTEGPRRYFERASALGQLGVERVPLAPLLPFSCWALLPSAAPVRSGGETRKA